MTSTGTVLAPPSGRYVIDPAGSSVAFVTRHMLGLGRVRGTLRVAGGLVAIADRPEDSRVEAEIAASSFSPATSSATARCAPDFPRCSPASGDLIPLRQHPPAPQRLVSGWDSHRPRAFRARRAHCRQPRRRRRSRRVLRRRHGRPLRPRHPADAGNGSAPPFRRDHRTRNQNLTSHQTHQQLTITGKANPNDPIDTGTRHPRAPVTADTPERSRGLPGWQQPS